MVWVTCSKQHTVLMYRCVYNQGPRLKALDAWMDSTILEAADDGIVPGGA